jgi:hypothetical protein
MLRCDVNMDAVHFDTLVNVRQERACEMENAEYTAAQRREVICANKYC